MRKDNSQSEVDDLEAMKLEEEKEMRKLMQQMKAEFGDAANDFDLPRDS